MTRWIKPVVVVAIAASATFWGGAMSLRAEDKTADSADVAKSEEQAEKPAKPGKLVMPWREMKSLSDEQKQQISDIHKRTNAEKKKLDAKEREEILALLSDEQKVEAKKIEDDKKMSGKLKSVEKAEGSE